MKFIPYLLYLWLIGFHEVIGRDVTSILGCTINVAALVLLLVAYYKTEIAAAWFGLLVGLVLSAGQMDKMGWNAVFFATVGLFANHVKERLNLDSMYARLLLIFGGTMLLNILIQVQSGLEFIWLRLLVETIPSAIYTTIIGWIIFLFKDGRITYERTKSIF